MEFLSAGARDDLAAGAEEMLRKSIAAACRSNDPVRRELGQAMADGTITPREALTGSAYRELLLARIDRVAQFQAATEEERRRLADADDPPPAPAPKAKPDEDSFFANPLRR